MSQKYKVYINNKLKVITDNWESFCAGYKLIAAAGGLVYNNEDQLLMIFRDGKWDLPKGKLEVGENIEQCAIREVEEECGISGLKIMKQLQETYHTYKLNEQQILKCTYWFEMQSSFKGNLAPQTKEGITAVIWVGKEDISEKLENSFENIVELLKTK